MSVSALASPRLSLRRSPRRTRTGLFSASDRQLPERYRETTKSVEDWPDESREASSIGHCRLWHRRDEYFRCASKPASWRHFFTASHGARIPRRPTTPAQPRARLLDEAALLVSSKHTVAKRICGPDVAAVRADLPARSHRRNRRRAHIQYLPCHPGDVRVSLRVLPMGSAGDTGVSHLQSFAEPLDSIEFSAEKRR